ncbi:hypothetical protein [Pirellulimonas nuda]|nr:hypothetical protein [Pirellulimonas nuda]
MNLPITDTLLDRFADGELTPIEERALLASLDAAPDGWRRCALAMVEARVLGRQMKGLVAAPTAAPTTAPAAVAPKPTPRTTPNAAWLTLAAGLLIGIGMTALVTSNNGWFPSPNTVAQSDGAPTTDSPIADGLRPVEALPQAPIHANESITLWFHNNQGERHSVQVPLVDAAELNDRYDMEFQSAVSEDLRRDLEQNGYRLTTRQRYAPLYLEGGRPFVVPVEDTQITPVAYEVL